MSYDIQDDELPLRVRIKLRERGWIWDASAQSWRKNDYSLHAEDNARAWEPTIAAVTAEAEAEQEAERVAAQMNATPGHTGTQAEYKTD
jgi:hypothetical protein